MAKTATAAPAKKSMSKSAVTATLAEQVEGVSKKQVAAIMAALTELAYKQAKNSFTIPGIGKLVLQNRPARPARPGRNPATGETIMIPAKPASKVVKFRVAKAAKDAILGKK